MRTFIDLLLLVAAAVLVVAGIVTYPNVHAGLLAGLLAAAALLIAPIGRRTEEVA
ncbi:hypothetical protein [Nocardiopsis alba]|uniref:hypothetical protein n=1 Tax=Nocardiopsis alba TaxID=53437 RepID=UPI00363AA5EE